MNHGVYFPNRCQVDCQVHLTRSTAVCTVGARCGRPFFFKRTRRPFLSIHYSFNDSPVVSLSAQWRGSTRKGPCALRPVFQQSPQGCSRNNADVCPVEHRSFRTSEGVVSAASFSHCSVLQAISAVMLWPVHVRIVPQASERLCPAQMQTRCDICLVGPVVRCPPRERQIWVRFSLSP